MDDDDSAAWHHADETARRRAEDEALERSRKLTAEHNKANAEFEKWSREWWDRMRNVRL